jgi:hypothetical protein
MWIAQPRISKIVIGSEILGVLLVKELVVSTALYIAKTLLVRIAIQFSRRTKAVLHVCI